MPLPRVVALIGGLGLVAAFPMPWFNTQGLLLSGQFLHAFLGRPAELSRFLPGLSPGEAQVLRLLVDAFPACGLVAGLTAIGAGLRPGWRGVGDVVLALTAIVPLLGWAGGLSRLPPGSGAEIGLWLIPLASLAIALGLFFERLKTAPRPAANEP